MAVIRCSKCQSAYPEDSTPYCCPSCGGVYDFDGPPIFSPDQARYQQPGLWRYRQALELPENAPVVTLGEGSTPLVWGAGPVGFKMESLNPTGSYKDRGSALLASHLAYRGITQAVEDSSGNAGASFAAYAARAGVKARVYIPDSASGPKRTQIEMFGAEVRAIPGPRSEAAKAVLNDANAGIPYASHAYLPFGLPGIATIAYELWEQMEGQIPGSVIAPVGHGGLLLGVLRGFAALKNSKLTDRMPYLVGVQAAACAPLAEAFASNFSDPDQLAERFEGVTVAEGVRVTRPIRAQALLKEIPRGAGEFTAVPEDDILPAAYEMARLGVYVEPTSALAWCAWKQRMGKIPEPVILIITGSGLKYTNYS